jgi:hypothetical protein
MTRRELLRKICQDLASTTSALRIIRAPLLLTAMAALVFALPPQTRDIYRAIVGDIWAKTHLRCLSFNFWPSGKGCDYFNLLSELLVSALGIVVLCATIWLVTSSLTAALGYRLPRNAHVATTTLAWAPRVMIAVILCALTLGVYASLPLSEDQTAINEIAEHLAKQARTSDQITAKYVALKADSLRAFTRHALSMTVGAAVFLSLAVASLILIPKSAIDGPNATFLRRFLTRVSLATSQ